MVDPQSHTQRHGPCGTRQLGQRTTRRIAHPLCLPHDAAGTRPREQHRRVVGGVLVEAMRSREHHRHGLEGPTVSVIERASTNWAQLTTR